MKEFDFNSNVQKLDQIALESFLISNLLIISEDVSDCKLLHQNVH